MLAKKINCTNDRRWYTYTVNLAKTLVTFDKF